MKNEKLVPLIAMPVKGMEGNLMVPSNEIQDRIDQIGQERVKENVAFQEFARHYFPTGD